MGKEILNIEMSVLSDVNEKFLTNLSGVFHRLVLIVVTLLKMPGTV